MCLYIYCGGRHEDNLWVCIRCMLNDSLPAYLELFLILTHLRVWQYLVSHAEVHHAFIAMMHTHKAHSQKCIFTDALLALLGAYNRYIITFIGLLRIIIIIAGTYMWWQLSFTLANYDPHTLPFVSAFIFGIALLIDMMCQNQKPVLWIFDLFQLEFVYIYLDD